jgi:hypothetical protein
MLNCQPSSHRETLTTTHADLCIIETVTDKSLHISRHQSFITETDIQQQVLCNPFQSNLVIDLPPIYSQSKVNQNLPLISTPAFNKPLLPKVVDMDVQTEEKKRRREEMMTIYPSNFYRQVLEARTAGSNENTQLELSGEEHSECNS